MPVAGKIAGQRHLSALRDGIILTMPLIIIGSVFLILTSLPIRGMLISWRVCLGTSGPISSDILLTLRLILWR